MVKLRWAEKKSPTFPVSGVALPSGVGTYVVLQYWVEHNTDVWYIDPKDRGYWLDVPVEVEEG